jgi:ABC-2 type transport system ATP-binding protein
VRDLNSRGKTIIYTTHIMAEAETLCQRVAIIDRGQVLALDTVAGLKAALKREAVIHIEGVFSAEADEAVQGVPGVRRTARTAVDGHTRLTVVGDDQQLLPRLIETLISHQALIQRIMPEDVSLEDVFIARTGRTLAEDTRES